MADQITDMDTTDDGMSPDVSLPNTNNANDVNGAVGGGGSAGTTTDGGLPTAPVFGPPPVFATVDLPELPPQYSTGNLGFFTRQTEVVPTSVTTGPDGALYVGELTGIPYPDGYARVLRIGDPNATTGFDGEIASGVPQVFASGFSQIQSLGFAPDGTLYVLEYVNSNAVYDPTQNPGDLPPSKLIRVGTDGVRATISGPELKLGNYLVVDKATGDVFVAINNADIDNGKVLRYHTDAATGDTSVSTVASGLENPRGMSFGPDGNLYVLEGGRGTDAGSPDAASAPVIPFIPGLISERGGYTGAITKIDLGAEGGQERVLTGLASFREFNPTTNADRVISIGPNGMTIAPDGTVYIASGGGLAPETADAIGPLADYLKGVVRVDGLFGKDPANATVTPQFDALAYAAANGPDGSTTLFNTESNLNDITVGSDGKLYAVDAARNVVYGLDKGGKTLDSVTVLQKRPPVLTPAQYGVTFAAGGDPSATYQAEVGNITQKGPNGLPLIPGSIGDSGTAPTGDNALPGTPPPRGEDAIVGSQNASTDLPTVPTGPVDPTLLGPSDPTSAPVLPGNIYAGYFDSFVGNYAPAASDPLIIPAGDRGSYTVSNVFSFGDRLADDGGDYSNYAISQFFGGPSPNNPVYYNGGLSDGPNWTADLAKSLGVPVSDQDHNFAYEFATSRVITDPSDPFQSVFNFQGQINLFQQQNGAFQSTDLVTVTFGGNDLTVIGDNPTAETVSASVKAIIDGLDTMAGLGAKHFLVTNLPDITIAPLFSDPGFLAASGIDPAQLTGLVNQFNAELKTSLDDFKANSGLDVKELDLNKLFGGIVDDPAAYGFSNITQPVLVPGPLPGATQDFNPNAPTQDPAVQHATLFTDPFFHPTALGQSIIAETARSALA